MNNGYGDENNSCCYFHPKEVVVGVCPLCLNERLLILASKQGHAHHSSSSAKVVSDKKPLAINLPKLFAFGSLLNRFEFRHSKSDDHDTCSSSSSQEDSFISIKFEENGVTSWEKGTVSNVSMEKYCSMSWSKQNNSQSVVEHAKTRASSLRWRKKIGHLLQHLRWKRSSKVAVETGGVKVMRKKGWIRILTKRGTANKGIE
ncbi:hypothetical protein ACOSQ2_010214 [Xanthoceras sorbifolium]